MERKPEYHDPDYPQASTSASPQKPVLSVEQKVLKIKSIVRREFSKEMEARQEEIATLDQRMASARHLMYRLRYRLVSQYYEKEKLKLTTSQINSQIAAQTDPRAKAQVANILRESQVAIPPPLKKLLGKKTMDLDEIFKHREPRAKSRVNYVNMVRPKNTTTSADATVSLRPEEVKREVRTEPSSSHSHPKKIPRQLMPKIESVYSLNEATRNQVKHRYRIIIGNTSKYAPPASQADRSSHCWLLYVRGAPPSSVAGVVTHVVVKLHKSYAPHHRLTITKPPFHVSRRGWGEFPAKIELNFAHPELNRPVVVEHTIKLDRNYTGLQTLGAETVIDVWLHSDEDMIKNAFKDVEDEPFVKSPEKVQIKQEMDTIEPDQNDTWFEFFNNEKPMDVDEMINKQNDDFECLLESSINDKEINTETEENLIPSNVITPSSPKKKIMKYIDPTTGKVYYLEIDRKIDLSKVQEIVLNPDNDPKSIKVSPMKNGCNVKKKKMDKNFEKAKYNSIKNSHILHDHCYCVDVDWLHNVDISKKEPTSVLLEEKIILPVDNDYGDLVKNVEKMATVRGSVSYLLSKISLVSQKAKDPEYLKQYPFVVANEAAYWKMDFAKRRNYEWSRAKLINKILSKHLKTDEQIWRTKQILLFSRLHGYHPVIKENNIKQENTTENWSSWNDLENTRKSETSIKELYPKASDVTTLSIFDMKIPKESEISIESIDTSDSDIDVSGNTPVKVKQELPEVTNELEVLPVSEGNKLKFLFLEKKCAEIGVELRNEDVGNGYSYSLVHEVLLSAMRQFAEETIRSALAIQTADGSKCEDLPNLPVWESSDSRSSLSLSHVYRAVSLSRASLVTSRGLGATPIAAYKL